MPSDPHPRWERLTATSRSGKALFVCLDCGRVSPTPDKTCDGARSDWYRQGWSGLAEERGDQ